MKKRQLVGLCVTLVLLVCVSCGDDSDNPVVPPIEDLYKDLTLRDNVLHNLQSAYVSRNIDRYAQLLDDGFVFYFSAADVKYNRVPVDWDRAAELAATRNIFNRNFADPEVKPVSKIDLALTYTEGEDSWDPVTPEDQEAYPDETWYEKTVRYDMIITSGQTNFTGLNIQASFIVRRAEVDGKSIWRIVSWRDDTQNQLVRLRASSARGGSSEETTWGKVKSLYSQ